MREGLIIVCGAFVQGLCCLRIGWVEVGVGFAGITMAGAGVKLAFNPLLCQCI